MLKRILLTLLQLVIFEVLLALGGFWALLHLLFLGASSPFLHVFSVIPVWRSQVGPNRFFTFDGILFALLLCLVIVLIEALRKRFRPWGILTLLAFVLAILISFIPYFNFGFQTITP